MLRAAVIALATFVFSVTVAGAIVLSTAYGQTMTPTDTPSASSSVSPMATTTLSPSPKVQGEKIVPSGATNTGRNSY